jgi:ATP-dependent exoDNAse (exonuclease V) alpha subunit
MNPQALDLNDEFRQALYFMEQTEKSLFVTGKAGTGKSTLLRHFCDTTKKKPIVLAPTGVAALNVGGQTIHHFFRFSMDVTVQKIRDKKIRPRNSKLYKKIKTIVIDEVSMLRADLLDCVDAALRLYGPNAARPFGGVQLIFVGDLYQLPPVVTGDEREIFARYYKTPYFFSARALDEVELEIIELEKVYRQKDQVFIDLLNRIRNNSVEEKDIALLNERLDPHHTPDRKDFSIHLTPTNRKADEINEVHLSELPGKAHTFVARVEGDFGKEYHPTAVELRFKVGAQIMLVNNDRDARWVNGTIGVITAFETDDDGEPYLQVSLHDQDEEVDVYPFTWEVVRFKVERDAIVTESIGSFTQYPFRLAWALTIHKSQGKTFERVVIDLDRGAFAAGQTYVALSRCTSLNGIVLKIPVSKHHIRTDHRIFGFLTGYRYRRSELALPLESKIAYIEQAIGEKARLSLTYLKANDSKSNRIVVPISVGTESYMGKQFSGMRAFCMTAQEERMFRVDRILEMQRVK